MGSLRILTWGSLMALLCAGAARAEVFTATCVFSGWYRADGLHQPNGKDQGTNYAVGKIEGQLYRNYFVFDLDMMRGNPISAELRIENPVDGFLSTGPELYRLFDVSRSVYGILPLDHGQGIGIYADLGSGRRYGERTVSTEDQGKQIEVTLGPLALTDLAEMLRQPGPKRFVVGGALADPESHPGAASEYCFGNSGSASLVRCLVIETSGAAEPGVVVQIGGLVVTGAICWGLRSRFRARRRSRPHRLGRSNRS